MSLSSTITGLGPIAYWSMQSDSSTEDDLVGSADLTYTGSPPLVGAVPGFSGVGALRHFENATDYAVTSGAPAVFDTPDTAVTILAWIQVVVLPAAFVWAVVASHSAGHVSPFYAYGLGGNNTDHFRCAVDGDGSFVPFDTGHGLSAGNLRLIAYTVDLALASNEQKLYINDALAVQANRAGTAIGLAGDLGVNTIPALLTTGFNTGLKIAHVALFDKALSLTDVQSVYAARDDAGVPAPEILTIRRQRRP